MRYLYVARHGDSLPDTCMKHQALTVTHSTSVTLSIASLVASYSHPQPFSQSLRRCPTEDPAATPIKLVQNEEHNVSIWFRGQVAFPDFGSRKQYHSATSNECILYPADGFNCMSGMRPLPGIHCLIVIGTLLVLHALLRLWLHCLIVTGTLLVLHALLLLWLHCLIVIGCMQLVFLYAELLVMYAAGGAHQNTEQPPLLLQSRTCWQ